ncbi:MAG: S8 family serine peptidase, partial [Agathobacter sp.]|nr:S8 family serine peptidase [Agathobacter sp.]
AEMTRENYSTWSLYDYPYTIYEADGLTYVDVELDETESDEYVQTYIEAERATAAELYSENNNSFVAENFMARDMSVTYVSQYSPCVFADLSVTKIAELIGNEEVVCIEYNNIGILKIAAIDLNVDSSEILESIEVIRADEATSVYNVTGSGIKIGQIEPTCPATNAVYINPNGDNTMYKGMETYHANTVYTIMHTVAHGATYYASGMQCDENSYVDEPIYEQIEWLLAQGVNIINMSAGYDEEGDINSYTVLARWVDHIAYNHDVHFVHAAGNNMNSTTYDHGVMSPGLAYNIITVGNTYRTSDVKHIIHPSSSYNHNGYSGTTYKPDLVAPGTYTDDYGTSYSAPLVTGTIALMCEYKPALKTQQHIVKAILAATTSKSIYRYVTTDNNFEIYGAGMLDARSALYAIYAGDYVNYTGELTTVGTSRSYTMNVTTSDTRMRVALAYANKIEFASDNGTHSEEDTPYGNIGDLNLSVYDPDGNLIAYVFSGALERQANLKILEFDTNGVSGNYTIKVTLVTEASGGRSINFGVAWR